MLTARRYVLNGRLNNKMILSFKKESNTWMRPGLILAMEMILFYQPHPAYAQTECADLNSPTPPKQERVYQADDNAGNGGYDEKLLGEMMDGDVRRRVCFLKGVTMREVDNRGEWAACSIQERTDGDGVERVYVKASGWGRASGDEAAVTCQAQCLCWDKKIGFLNPTWWCADTDGPWP